MSFPDGLESLVIDAQIQDYPDYSNPNVNPFDQTYLNSLPMVTAYGFSLCWKLGTENPDQAVINCDSVAYCALGIIFCPAGPLVAELIGLLRNLSS